MQNNQKGLGTVTVSLSCSSEQMTAFIAELHARQRQRLGTPEDIAAITAFLLPPEADWITGQIIGVDGGRSTLRTND